VEAVEREAAVSDRSEGEVELRIAGEREAIRRGSEIQGMAAVSSVFNSK
jgi:hypothetical protein